MFWMDWIDLCINNWHALARPSGASFGISVKVINPLEPFFNGLCQRPVTNERVHDVPEGRSVRERCRARLKTVSPRYVPERASLD